MSEESFLESLYQLKQRDLRVYIMSRLTQSLPYPPVIGVFGEEPEHLIIEMIRRNNTVTFRKRTVKTLYSIFNAQKKLILKRAEFDKKLFSRILLLIETFRFKFFEEDIHYLSSNSEYLINEDSLYCGDLYEQTLRTLAFLQDSPPGYVAIWSAIFDEILLINYQKVAFLGMRLCSLAQGTKAFAKLARFLNKSKDSASLANCFSDLVAQYYNHDHLAILEKLVNECLNSLIDEYDTRRFIHSTLKSFPFVKNYKRLIIDGLIPIIKIELREDLIDDKSEVSCIIGRGNKINFTEAAVADVRALHFSKDNRQKLAADADIEF